MKKTTALLFLAMLPCLLPAQPTDENVSSPRKAYETAQQLKKGVLVVRLPSGQNKINAMKKVIANPQVSEKDRARMQKQLEETIEENKSDNLTTIAAFRANYHFSEVYFVYDTAVAFLKKGISKGYFLSDDLKPDPDLELTGKSWFTLRTGYTDVAQSSGAEALIISDDNLNDLPPPFPGLVRLDNFNYLINRTLAPEIAVRKRMTKAVKKLEERLTDFYERR